MRRLLLPIVVLALVLCPAATAAAAPTVVGRSAIDIGRNTATVRASVNPNGAPAHYRFEYGRTTDYGAVTADVALPAGSDPVDVEATLAGLSQDTTYYFRVVAWSDDDPAALVHSGDRRFTTLAPPVPSTGVVRETRADGATLVGRVDPNRSATRWWYEYGRTRSYGARTPAVDFGRGPLGPVTAVISGLEPRTTYHVRLVASNAVGTRSGRDRTFQTLSAPSAITVSSPVRRVAFGGETVVRGRVRGGGVGRIRIALEAQPFPFTAPWVQAGPTMTTAADGSFRLVSPPLWISTRLRVATRTSILAMSEPITAYSRVRVGARVICLGARRCRIEGNVTPRVNGAKVSLQRLTRKGGWAFVQRSTARRLARGRFGYRLTVPRASKRRQYRILVTPRNLAHVRGTSGTVSVPKRARKRS